MPASVPPPLQHQTSRWQPGPSTFGPKGRLVSTAVTLIIPAWFVFLALYVGLVTVLIGIPVIVAWCGCIAPWILRDTWARDVYHVPEPPVPPLHQMQTWDGQPIPTLADHVAGQGASPSYGQSAALPRGAAAVVVPADAVRRAATGQPVSPPDR